MHNILLNQLSLENIIDHVDGNIICCKNDEFLTIVYASSHFYKMLGYEEGEAKALFENSPSSILCNEPPLERSKLEEQLRKTGSVESELKLIKKDGHHLWVNCRLTLMTGEDGEEYFCGIMTDVTLERRSCRREREQMEAIKKAKSELAASEERYRIIMEQTADPIFDFDLQTNQMYCSPAFKMKFDLNIAGLKNFWNTLRNSDVIYEEDKEEFLHHAVELLNGNNQRPKEYRIKNADGQYYWYWVRSTVICNEAGTPVRIITFATDIDKQKKETLRLRAEAEHDLLTGLYNHVTTTVLIDKAIAESKGDSRHALFVIDIDNFKNVNDNLGHLLGDELLEEFASQLKQQFREDDIIGRMGGDEFVVFLHNIASDKVLQLKSRLLNDIFRQTHLNGKDTCSVSCSVGVSVYPTDGLNYADLFQKADIAMYAAKNSGKDASCIYTPELGDALPNTGNSLH